MREFIQNIKIHALPHLSTGAVTVDILRLDLMHPVVSGNKWFKLQYYLSDALASGKDTVAGFGGAYSNHIVAMAFAAKEKGLHSIGYIRGEKPPVLNATLSDAMEYGMELRFVERDLYRDKHSVMQAEEQQGTYWIMEGGYGKKGAAGAADILRVADTRSYTDILCAAGTGTMMAGLTSAAAPGQYVTGISVLKNHRQLDADIRALLDEAGGQQSFSIMHDYHFGGYGKHPPELIRFMQTFWQEHGVPTDIVYTSKLLFAVQDLLNKNHFPAGSRLLVVHSGGLQGNRSLPAGTLSF